MQFESITDALNMAGHGPYVWSAYAITMIILLALYILPVWKMRKVKAEIRRIQVRDSQIAKSTEEQSR